MSFDYLGLLTNDVNPIILEFGIAATLIVKDNRFNDIDAGDVIERVTEYDVIVVLDNQQKTYQDGKLITDTRKRAILSPEGLVIVPKINDELRVNSETFKITQVLETKPADIVVLYELTLEN